jgi:NADPH:quinone reductase-like Zn-dependent oxidoreductase
MEAIVYDQYGPPDALQLKDVAMPAPSRAPGPESRTREG